MDKNNGDLGFREGRERVYKILDRFQGKKPVVDIERAVYFTESMKQTEGKILVLRWALAMKNVAEKMTVYIDEDNLLAGRGGKAARIPDARMRSFPRRRACRVEGVTATYI